MSINIPSTIQSRRWLKRNENRDYFVTVSVRLEFIDIDEGGWRHF